APFGSGPRAARRRLRTDPAPHRRPAPGVRGPHRDRLLLRRGAGGLAPRIRRRRRHLRARAGRGTHAHGRRGLGRRPVARPDLDALALAQRPHPGHRRPRPLAFRRTARGPPRRARGAVRPRPHPGSLHPARPVLRRGLRRIR
ncbi:MAG: hypothetical protein AVDCRST_MAG15-1437, partial [uncultured Rubellimicrobium sp.]